MSGEREPRMIEQILEPAIDEARIASAWQRIRNAQGARRELPILRWGLGLAAAGIAAVICYLAWPSHGGPLTSPTVAISAGAVVEAAAPRIVQLDDDSRLDLAPGARLEVLTNEADRFVTLLHHGRAHFDVHPGGPRRWEIETSQATVEVVGTAFVVEADEHRVIVEVERGVVMVRGEHVPGRVVRMTGGRLVIEDPVKTADATAPVVPPVTQVAPPIAPPEPTPPPAKVEAPAKPKTKPAHHASPKLVSAATAAPPAPAAPAHDLAATLVDADQRRSTGDAAGAAAVLEHALIGARRDEAAGLAAFTLGRIYLEDLHAPDRAVTAFEQTIAIGAPHGLLEDAYARRIEALVRAHRSDDATSALAEYDRLYPHGVHRGTVHTLLSPAK